MNYEVIVGNVGTVYGGGDKEKALGLFNDYKTISQQEPSSRASGEDVTLMADGEIIAEHVGQLANHE